MFLNVAAWYFPAESLVSSAKLARRVPGPLCPAGSAAAVAGQLPKSRWKRTSELKGVPWSHP